MRGEGDVSLAFGRLKAGLVAAVELVEDFGGELVVAHFIEQRDECAVALAVDVFEFDGHRFGEGEGAAAEEVGRFVVGAHHFPLVFFDDGRELVQVADHEQLHASEGQAAVFVAAQYVVHGVQEVGAHHADFVNDEQIKTLDEANFFAGKAPLSGGVAAVFGQKEAEGQLEQRVQGHAARVDGRHAGGRCNGHAFDGIFFEVLQKSSFSCAGLAGEEDVFIGAADIVESKLELWVGLVVHF